ncbi:receptor-like protein EIX1 [Cornus florida]|uniref:receptor-like protein EIX1 n=1 Tax=Cornus florida TaxID=4283 RepID=UPI00289C831B|nr:receptor-like protein EIX1 [Cornus florida]XP_059629270.1 receptor-like protein EIX1 [Cornus florida]XP_059629271.1 receptor-like protein EIX1 [Cornus florida]
MMMSTRIAPFLLWLLSSTALFNLRLLLLCDGINIPDDEVVCNEKEKRALLSFKQGLTDPSNRLSSWFVEQDCCTWTGVRCNNITGRVVELHLHNDHSLDDYESYQAHSLGGKITPSLLELEYLSYLDLSNNDFTGASVPSFLGSIGSLRYLNLSLSFFEGLIPHQLGNLSNLRFLDLTDHNLLSVDGLSWIAGLHSLEFLDMSGIDLHEAADLYQSVSKLKSLSELHLSGCGLKGLIPHQLGNLSSLRHLDLSYNDQLYVDDLSLIARLYSLEYLDMTGVNLSRAVDWLQAVSMLPSLSQLYLFDCKLEKILIPTLARVNFSSLKVLDLSHNHFECEIPDQLFNLTSSLVHVDLSHNFLYGHIPRSISNLHMLSYLDFEKNILSGQIPDELGQLKHLEYVSLIRNSLSGPIPASIGNLSALRVLFLNENQLNGSFPKSVGFLSNLEELHVGQNSISGIVSEINFAKLSKLKILEMFSNPLFFNVTSDWVPPFQLDELRMSSCEMGPTFPSWLRTQASLSALDISESKISDVAPEWLWKWASRVESVDLSNNHISGDISNVLLNSTVVELSSNLFKGQLPHLSPNVLMLNLANNSLSGPIFPFLCQYMKGESMLVVLDLSNNLLSGELPHCWMHWQNLVHVNLGRNHLFGKIPNSMGSLSMLESLQLHSNKFLGELPLSLRNCTVLKFINLGENELSGLIPSWIGELLSLGVLGLRSNKFIGNIPSQICRLSKLIILDLGNNGLSGPIPKCFKNISVMTMTNSSHHYAFRTTRLFTSTLSEFYMNSFSLVIKGREAEYNKNLGLVRCIDLSSNNLSGSIPDEFSSLHALQYLNLSHNQITGKIPKNIGGMAMLESFDLSRNHLSGEIPQSMCNLTFLSYLNLSYNNFFGRIPSSTQLQSFDATSYIGNAELCGVPLNKSCTGERESQGRGVALTKKEEDKYEMIWFYIGMGPGFAVGFWVVCGTLLLKTTWRHAYFQFLDRMEDQMYLAIMLKVNSIRRKFKRSNDA